LREQSDLCSGLGTLLTGMPDLYRLAGRIGLRLATPRDLLALADGLGRLPRIRETLAAVTSEGLTWIKDTLPHNLQTAREKIEQAIAENPPATLRDGGVFRDGYHAELDELRDLTRGGKEWIAALVKAEREQTGISSLKIGYTNVFGYYIEVTNANLKNVPDHYIRKQTLANGERYITPDLKEKESMILKAEEKIIVIEQRLFDELCRELDACLEMIQTAAGLVSHLDVFLNFGILARDRDYCRPLLNEGGALSITDGRHPVVELLKRRGEFVANDTELGDQSGRFHIITGPNMAGKSTYIRQIALITLLAHCGSFVPARAAVTGLADRIFTRIGASDYLAGGLSTFMVEMTETANILNNATGRSLVILDEIGRGTSTYDGLSIAWAVSEYIIEKLKCRTLFATHFHELAELSNRYPQAKNFNISVKEWNSEIIFLHKIVAGCTDRSYGVYVARLAGIPEPVIAKAKGILNLLECEGRSINLSEQDIRQLDLFAFPAAPAADPALTGLIDQIKNLDIDAIKPLDALNILCDIQNRLKSGK
jgi:DNA mismatch repair protein MutS